MMNANDGNVDHDASLGDAPNGICVDNRPEAPATATGGSTNGSCPTGPGGGATMHPSNSHATEGNDDDAGPSTPSAPPEDQPPMYVNGGPEDPSSSSPSSPPRDHALLMEPATIVRPTDPSSREHSMELNVALESVESMRRLNLEVEFSSGPTPFPVSHERCTYCQREAMHKFASDPPPPPKRSVANGNAATNGGEGGINIGRVKLDGSRMRRFGRNVGSFFSKSQPTTGEGNEDDMSTGGAKSSVGSLFSKSQSTAGTSNEDDMSTGGAKSSPPSLAFRIPPGSESTGQSPASNRGSAENRRASRRNILKKAPKPCLTCGHPTCSSHSSSTLSKNHISICQPCSYLFELDFLVDVIANTASDPIECQRKVDDMVDCYDRARLLLLYTSQYADDIATALESRSAQSNKIGAGSSATGVVSGVAGVVGCGALLFPPVAAAGVPLLIASLVFGGGATAAQTGNAAASYFSEPERLAEKMVALHGMVLSLLRITEVLSYGLLKNHLNVNYSVEGHEEGEKVEEDGETPQREALAREINDLLEKHGVTTTKSIGAMKSAVAGGIVATEVASTGAVAGSGAAITSSAAASGASMVGRNSRFFGRVGTTAASSARFIPIAGGLLSAACVFVEGRELKRTLSSIKEGNPCAMAEQVRSIRDELHMLPNSSMIAVECSRVFKLAQEEKLKKASMVENDTNARQGLQDVGDVALKDVSQGDIGDMIDVMETKAEVDALELTTARVT